MLFGWSRKVVTNATKAEKGDISVAVVDNTEHAKGIVSSDGFGVVCSVGGAKLVRTKHFEEEGESVFTSLSGRDDIFFPKCGHFGPLKFEILLWGREKLGFELPANFISGFMRKTANEEFLCPRCHFEKARKGAIHCCLCGQSILPGDGIALYGAESEGIHETATIIDGAAVGCLRSDCCPSFGFYAGNWDGQGIDAAKIKQIMLN